MANTKPSTPFGIWFAKLGVGKHRHYYGIVDTYESFETDVQNALQYASGWVAIINDNLKTTPDFVWGLIQLKFPDVTKEQVEEGLVKLATNLKLVQDNVPTTLNDAIAALQTYLSKFEDNAWIAATKFAVTVLTDILSNKKTLIEIIASVLDYVYVTFIKGKI